MNFRTLLQLLIQPVRRETALQLKEIWNGIHPRFQTDRQMLGRHEEGCGATIGVMPRCDFACTCCYLGVNANRTPELPIAKIKEQMRALRQRLGVWGNLQLTDGEVTLRKSEDLIEILRYARKIELIPMIMTHGDRFRRHPGLLEKLILEGGLAEISLHIDITQRGRLGKKYKYASKEADLMPLREDFASYIRKVRKSTKKPLRVASTVTVVPSNVSEIPDIVSWYKDNSDVFRMVSFQPVALVGRTHREINDVDRRQLWEHIAKGLGGKHPNTSILDHQWWLGHPECSCFVMGITSGKKNSEFFFHPISIAGGTQQERLILSHFYEKWGGVTFRGDTQTEKMARAIGMFLQSPTFFMTEFPRYLWTWFRKLNPKNPVRGILEVMMGKQCVHRFTVVCHHFMSKEELNTPLGQERVEHCAFKVPINNEFISMCELNATEKRDHFYKKIHNLHRAKREKVNVCETV